MQVWMCVWFHDPLMLRFAIVALYNIDINPKSRPLGFSVIKLPVVERRNDLPLKKKSYNPKIKIKKKVKITKNNRIVNNCKIVTLMFSPLFTRWILVSETSCTQFALVKYKARSKGHPVRIKLTSNDLLALSVNH